MPCCFFCSDREKTMLFYLLNLLIFFISDPAPQHFCCDSSLLFHASLLYCMKNCVCVCAGYPARRWDPGAVAVPAPQLSGQFSPYCGLPVRTRSYGTAPSSQLASPRLWSRSDPLLLGRIPCFFLSDNIFVMLLINLFILSENFVGKILLLLIYLT